LEPRKDPREGYIDVEGYKRVARAVNKRVSREWRNKEWLEFGGYLRRFLDHTGYHFTEEDRRYIGVYPCFPQTSLYLGQESGTKGTLQ